ncbi:MAG: peptidoglycan DD-metalloendopeptidase family protein [Flavobacteriaceae bacterium]|nr:peptidoglycan DD-metalloendopeptidase family protein [Flavobacteriaceae bacterium]
MSLNDNYQAFLNWSEKQHFSLKKLFPTIHKSEVYSIDLSISNNIVKTEAEFNNPAFFEEKLKKIQDQNPNKIIAGGYLEKRALYTSDIYNSDNSNEKRNVHLAVDFWLPEHTPVHALLDGEVFCSIHQTDYKGYGGFIILKHSLNNLKFYTLYGHLSKKCTEKFKVGELIKKGDKIGVLGNYNENGEWVAHLHFQLILDTLHNTNDFPGVAKESEIEYWRKNCPNPNLLFKLDQL